MKDQAKAPQREISWDEAEALPLDELHHIRSTCDHDWVHSEHFATYCRRCKVKA